jgi:hypothetical protein
VSTGIEVPRKRRLIFTRAPTCPPQALPSCPHVTRDNVRPHCQAQEHKRNYFAHENPNRQPVAPADTRYPASIIRPPQMPRKTLGPGQDGQGFLWGTRGLHERHRACRSSRCARFNFNKRAASCCSRCEGYFSSKLGATAGLEPASPHPYYGAATHLVCSTVKCSVLLSYVPNSI